jgi:hypothetical protein
MAIVSSKCSMGHKVTRKCHNKAAAICRKCAADAEAHEKRRQRDHKLDLERQANQQAYAARLVEIEDEIEQRKRQLNERFEEQNRQNALVQKKQDLINLQKKIRDSGKAPARAERVHRPATVTMNSVSSENVSATPPACRSSTENDEPTSNRALPEDNNDQPDWDKSEATNEWKEQKDLWGAENDALDALMSMIGK